MSNPRAWWEVATVALMLLAAVLVILGWASHDADAYRAAMPLAGMSIATATLALVRKP